MKTLENWKIRCQDCPCLIEQGGQWACDECFGQLCKDIDDCPEGVTAEMVETLEAKAKANKVEHGTVKQTAKTCKPKEDPEKEQIINCLKVFFEGWKQSENVKVTNKTKVLEFDIGENHYKLDLIRQRKPKK